MSPSLQEAPRSSQHDPGPQLHPKADRKEGERAAFTLAPERKENGEKPEVTAPNLRLKNVSLLNPD